MRISLGVALFALSVVAAAEPPIYSAIDLSELSGSEIRITDLNNSGQIIGRARQGDESWRGFLYFRGEFAYFDELLTGGQNYFPLAINNAGEVVLSLEHEPYALSPKWLYADGSLQLLNIPEDYSVTAINDLGQIVGSSPSSSYQVTEPYRYRYYENNAYVYANGSLELLVSPEGTALHPTDINNLGHIAGTGRDDDGDSTFDVMFLFQDGVYYDRRFGEQQSIPKVDDAGRVIGTIYNDSDSYSFAFYWQPSVTGWIQKYSYSFVEIDPAGDPQDSDSRAHDINAGGVAVGTVDLDYTEPGYESNYGVVYDGVDSHALIDQLLDPTAWASIKGATRINDLGWVVASCAPTGIAVSHVCLLQPVKPIVAGLLNRGQKATRPKLKSPAMLQIVLLSNSDVDATQIDLRTLQSGGGQAIEPAGYLVRDTDRDGMADLVIRLPAKDLGASQQDGAIQIVGQTYSGEMVAGQLELPGIR